MKERPPLWPVSPLRPQDGVLRVPSVPRRISVLASSETFFQSEGLKLKFPRRTSPGQGTGDGRSSKWRRHRSQSEEVSGCSVAVFYSGREPFLAFAKTSESVSPKKGG